MDRHAIRHEGGPLTIGLPSGPGTMVLNACFDSSYASAFDQLPPLVAVATAWSPSYQKDLVE